MATAFLMMCSSISWKDIAFKGSPVYFVHNELWQCLYPHFSSVDVKAATVSCNCKKDINFIDPCRGVRCPVRFVLNAGEAAISLISRFYCGTRRRLYCGLSSV